MGVFSLLSSFTTRFTLRDLRFFIYWRGEQIRDRFLLFVQGQTEPVLVIEKL